MVFIPAGDFLRGRSHALSGETIELYGTGFGATNPLLPASQLVTQPQKLAHPVIVTIGGKPATVQYAGRTGSGLDQLNVTVPANLPDGDQTLVAKIGGVQSQAGVLLTVQKWAWCLARRSH